MNQNKKVFRTADDILPALYLDMVFVEMDDPIFFSCTDDYGHLYLLSCYRADGEKREWLTARCSEALVIAVLSDQITIHDAFYSKSEQLFVLCMDAENPKIKASIVSSNQIPEEIFPTAGYYMEADEGEFEAEIQELQHRIKAREGATVSYWEEDGSMFFERYRVICINQAEWEREAVKKRNFFPNFFANISLKTGGVENGWDFLSENRYSKVPV